MNAAPSDKEVSISVVVPFFNEEENAPILYKQLTSVLDPINSSYELLFVDDGSNDSTFEVISALAQTDARLRILKFRRNFGQTPAMAAGIDFAKGDIIITMDGDLQNDPSDIPNFIREIHAGYDIVVGWRHDRKDKLITRKIPSQIANWLIGKVTGVSIKDNGCSLKAYRSTVMKNVPFYSEMHRFIPAVAHISGARIKEIKVRHRERKFGESKYGLSRIYRVLLDLVGIATLRAASSAPFWWFARISAPFLLLGVTILAIAFSPLASGLVLSAMLSGTGLLFISLGISLLLSGAIVELLHYTGDVRSRDLVRDTTRIVREL